MSSTTRGAAGQAPPGSGDGSGGDGRSGLRRYPVWSVRRSGVYDDLREALLASRQLTAADLALSPSLLHDPLVMKDMARAVERVDAALRGGERIVVFGDYDVDGVTSTALLLDFFAREGGRALPLLPHRLREGYGMKPAATRRALALAPHLIITADNGVSSHEAIAMARQAGVDVVVLDHHQPPERLPAAHAVVDPNRADCPYPFKGLAAVGVAFKLVQALADGRLAGDERRRYLNSLLDLVALGTVADVAPMIDENRLLTRRGLQILATTVRPGLAALARVAGLADRPTDTTAVGYFLGPRLNSAGRLASAELALRLLRTGEEAEASALAGELDALNARRQELQEVGVEEAERQVEEQGLAGDPILVVAGDDWHLGVVGLIASRLSDRHHRPALALSGARGDGSFTGSARSAAGYNLVEGIGRSADLLTEYGGHAAAAGLTLPRENLAALRRRLVEDGAVRLRPEDLTPCLELDLELAPRDLTLEALAQIDSLAPFGPGNTQPRFLVPRCQVAQVRVVGADGAHLKLRLAVGNRFCDAIAWRRGGVAALLEPGATVDVAGTLEGNRWNGETRLQLVLDDLRPSIPEPSP